MAFKLGSTCKTFRLINVSFALGILFILAISQMPTISEFVFDALKSTQWPENMSHIVVITLNWWLPSAVLFALFRFTNLLHWLRLNLLTHSAFLVANIALLAELAFLLCYGRLGYFSRWYFEAPWKIGLLIGCVSLVGCTIWYQWIERNSLVRRILSFLLSAECVAKNQT